MGHELATSFVDSIVMGILLVIPLWKIFEKAGKRPAMAFLVFFPFIGLMIVALILAFSRWPATEQQADTRD